MTKKEKKKLKRVKFKKKMKYLRSVHTPINVEKIVTLEMLNSKNKNNIREIYYQILNDNMFEIGAHCDKFIYAFAKDGNFEQFSIEERLEGEERGVKELLSGKHDAELVEKYFEMFLLTLLEKGYIVSKEMMLKLCEFCFIAFNEKMHKWTGVAGVYKDDVDPEDKEQISINNKIELYQSFKDSELQQKYISGTDTTIKDFEGIEDKIKELLHQ
jgi:hypothetical protein